MAGDDHGGSTGSDCTPNMVDLHVLVIIILVESPLSRVDSTVLYRNGVDRLDLGFGLGFLHWG